MFRAITEQRTKQDMKTTFVRDNTITPHSCTVFFIWAACFLFQRNFLPSCNQNCCVKRPSPSTTHTQRCVSQKPFLQEMKTIFSSDFHHWKSRKQVNWYLEVLWISRFFMDILMEVVYGHHDGERGNFLSAASTWLDSLSQTYTT